MNYRLVGFSEIDRASIASYCAIHNVCDSMNLGDVSEIQPSEVPESDIIFHGSPCQDVSHAGRNAGADIDSGTRSSLLWNALDIIQASKPLIIVWENVPNILSDKHRHNVVGYHSVMDDLGYYSDNYIINSISHVPQERNRLFVISINKELYRGRIEITDSGSGGHILEDIFDGSQIKVSDIHRSRYRETSGGGRVAGVIMGADGKRHASGTVLNPKFPMGTLTATDAKNPVKVYDGGVIRRLSTLECFRVMGFEDEDHEVASNVSSTFSLYHQAGNSVVVPVAIDIISMLYSNYIKYMDDVRVLSLFSGIGAFEKAMTLFDKDDCNSKGK